MDENMRTLMERLEELIRNVHQYVGARYVPNFIDDPWNDTTRYDPLDVVDNGSGTSYIAKKPVPPGTPLSDRNYWFLYGSSNGAILNLQKQIDKINGGLYNNIYDYGYTSGADITPYIQAFVDDPDSSALYLYMDGDFIINTIDFTTLESNSYSKRFIKSANTNFTGGGAVTIGLAAPNQELDLLYTAGSNPYARRFVRTSDNATSVRGATQNNVTFIDNVMNQNDSYFHWNILAISNYYTEGDGENCAEYLQVNNHADNDNWALCIEVNTDSSVSQGQRHSTRGIELLLKGKGDVSSNGGKRLGIHLISACNDSYGYNVDYGILFSSTVENAGNGFRYGILFDRVGCTNGIVFSADCSTTYAIDMHEAQIGQAALYIGNNHPVQFDNYKVVESTTLGVRTLGVNLNGSGKWFELTELETTDASVTPPTRFMRVFYNGTQYAIPLYGF